MGSSAVIPQPPPGFVPIEQAQGAIPPPPPGFVPLESTLRQPTPDAKISAQPVPYTLPWLKSKLYTAADTATQAIPALAATGMGILGAGAGGPLGAIGGAGIGGMGGEAGRQLIRRALGFESPQTSQEAGQQITKEGAIQGAVQGASEALPFLAPALKRAAVGQYERALAPTTKVNKAIAQKIAPKMMQRGLHGGLEPLEEQAAAQATTIRPQLDAVYAATPAAATEGSGPQVLAALDNLKGKYIVEGKVAQPAAVDAINGVQDIVRQYGNDISPQSLRQLKQVFDDPVAHAGGYAGADMATHYNLNAQKAAANSIRNVLHQASPDIAALDKEISFWLDVQKVTGESGLRRTGQEGGLLKTLGYPFMMSGGGAAGHALGGGTGAVEGAAAGFLTTAATMAIRTPAWRTASAVFKDRFADALARGSVGDVVALAGRLGVTGLEAQTAAPQSNQTLPRQ